MHLISPLPLPPQILHNLSFSFLLGITIIQREIENNGYAKFWGANKVHHGRVIHANSPVLSGSLPDTTPISLSPVQVTISPG